MRDDAERSESSAPLPSKIDRDGHLSLEWLQTLSSAGFSRWIRDRLSGNDVDIPFDPRDGAVPHDVFLDLLRNRSIPESVREALMKAAFTMLQNLAFKPEDFSTPVADGLLLLVPEILAKMSERADLVPTEAATLRDGAASALKQLIARTAVTEHATWPTTDRDTLLAARALQGLVTLKRWEPVGYWQREYARRGRHLLPLIFEAQSIYDPEVAFEWLAEQDWSQPIVPKTLAYLLPTLVRAHGKERIERLIVQKLLVAVDERWEPSIREACRIVRLDLGESGPPHSNAAATRPPEQDSVVSLREMLADQARLSRMDKASREVEVSKMIARVSGAAEGKPTELQAIINRGDHVAIPLDLEINRRTLASDRTFWEWFLEQSPTTVRVVNGECLVSAVRLEQRTRPKKANAARSGSSNPPATRSRWVRQCLGEP
ncbi:MAG TPA: hypothetical protein VJT73_07900 [Polyangiaceae bacterium]|nr:hypothetical protein [Polyangiaceae bacterium]